MMRQVALGLPRRLTESRTASRYCVSDKPAPTRLALLPFPVARIDEMVHLRARSKQVASDSGALGGRIPRPPVDKSPSHQQTPRKSFLGDSLSGAKGSG